MISAILVAAGRGTRMGPNVDKLFLEVLGQPIVAHTWRQLDRSAHLDEIIVVVRSGMEQAFGALAAQYGFRKSYRLVLGGKERQDSVWNGVQAVSPQSEIVLVQDGARPCLTGALIERTIVAARETGAAVAAERVTDTIKESSDGLTIARTLDRSRLWAVQTPQTFRTTVIRAALTAVRERGLHVTDDTAACELIGQPVRLIEGLTPNPKATAPRDLPVIELLLQTAAMPKPLAKLS
jgi:2-C-methyl-D-erythritol 4-phosphate cytidylyltransferase